MWSTLYLAKDFIFAGNVSIRHIIYAYCTGKAAAPLYYIVALVQLTLLTPWLAGRKDRRWLYVVTPVYLVGLYIYNITMGEMPRLYETVFPAWFGFYILVMDCRAGKWDAFIIRVRNWWIVAALAFSIFEAFFLLKIGCDKGFVASQIRFGGFLYTGAIVLAVVKNYTDKDGGGFVNRLLVSVGDCSYGIFYVHMLVLMAVQKLVSVMGLEQIWILNFLLCFIMTAVGSYLIVWLTRNIGEKIGFDKGLKIIGF